MVDTRCQALAAAKLDAVLEEKWAERERRHEETELYYAEQHRLHRERHIEIVERALEGWGDCVGGAPWSDVAAVAVDALLDDGVVFARMGSWEDDPDEPY